MRASIFVYPGNGGEIIEVEYSLNDTISEVIKGMRNQISKKSGIPQAKQRLILNGVDLTTEPYVSSNQKLSDDLKLKKTLSRAPNMHLVLRAEAANQATMAAAPPAPEARSTDGAGLFSQGQQQLGDQTVYMQAKGLVEDVIGNLTTISGGNAAMQQMLLAKIIEKLQSYSSDLEQESASRPTDP